MWPADKVGDLSIGEIRLDAVRVIQGSIGFFARPCRLAHTRQYHVRAPLLPDTDSPVSRAACTYGRRGCRRASRLTVLMPACSELPILKPAMFSFVMRNRRHYLFTG